MCNKCSLCIVSKCGVKEKEARAHDSTCSMTRLATTAKIGEPTAVQWTCW